MKKRVISAVIVIGLFIPLFLLGGIPFGAAVGIVAALGFKEMLELKESHNSLPSYIKIIGILCLELLIILNRSYQSLYTGMSYALLGGTVLLLTIPAIFNKKGNYTTRDALFLIGSILLLTLFFKGLILIMNVTGDAMGKKYLLYLILVSTITDLIALNCLATIKEFNCLIIDSEYLSSVSKIDLNLREKVSYLSK